MRDKYTCGRASYLICDLWPCVHYHSHLGRGTTMDWIEFQGPFFPVSIDFRDLASRASFKNDGRRNEKKEKEGRKENEVTQQLKATTKDN